MEKEADEEIADRYQHVQHKEQQDADGKDDQQESCSAARMQTGEGLRVSGRERKAGFMAVHGFVFSTMVLEGTADFRHAGTEDHVPDENQNLHQAADEGIADGGHTGTAEQAFHPGRNRNEKDYGQDDGQDDRKGHHDLVDAFTELSGKPFFELCGLFIQHAQHFGGILQGVHAVIKHGTHVDNTPDKGLSHPGMFFLERNKRRQLGDHGAVGTTDSDGGGVWRAHHDAFHDGLAANIEFLFLLCIHRRISVLS